MTEWINVLALMWLTTSFPQAGASQAGVVRGVVTDEKTNAPLAGVRGLIGEAS